MLNEEDWDIALADAQAGCETEAQRRRTGLGAMRLRTDRLERAARVKGLVATVDFLEQRIAALEAQLHRAEARLANEMAGNNVLTAQVNRDAEAILRREQRIAALEAHAERLRVALERYAKPVPYYEDDGTTSYAPFVDGGQLAKTALAAEPDARPLRTVADALALAQQALWDCRCLGRPHDTRWQAKEAVAAALRALAELGVGDGC